MKKIGVYFLMSLAVTLVVADMSYSEFKCIECHSKRPGALAMHQALTGEDCFGCHVRGEKLRQKGGIPEEKHQAFLKQRLDDDRCVRCHLAAESVLPSEEKEKPAMLSGSTYCPICRVVGAGDWKMCPKCGGMLLNLDKLIRKAALNPDQALCRECHLMEGSLKKSHAELVGSGFSANNDCLECHQAHSDCSGCHQ